MTDCIRCNGIGHLAITGDNDTICPTCEGTGEQPENTVAVVEPLSPLAQLRIDLQFYENSVALDIAHGLYGSSKSTLNSYTDMLNNIPYKFHMLFDEIDRLQAENAALREQVAKLTGAVEFYADDSNRDPVNHDDHNDEYYSNLDSDNGYRAKNVLKDVQSLTK